MALTALVPVLGAAVFLGDAAGGGLEGWDLLVDLVLLFISGALFHVYGFVLNEWADVEVDRASRDLTDKPLVSGRVSHREALGLAVGCAALSYVPLALVTQEPFVFLVLTASLLAGGIYDLYGKQTPLDVVLAGSLTLLLLTGALASGEFDPGSMRHWLLFACLGGLQFLQNLFQNAIEGGMKDADHDAAAGARTFAVVTGVHISKGELVMTRAFVLSAAVIKTAHALLMGATAFLILSSSNLPALPLDPWGYIIFVGLLGGAMLATAYRFMRRAPFDRSLLKRRFASHEVITYIGAIVLFRPVLGLLPAVLLIAIPFLWFVTSNALLFRTALEPGV
jgi:4-hydroxybenzoate polyprenyltransferase